MRKSISKLHYLTQDLESISHQEQVRIACEAGVKWIQLRVKNKNFDEWKRIALEVKVITEKFDCTLIINDNVAIANESDADGVHLGQQDLNWKEARNILGDKKIIGFSTHTIEELNAAKNYDVEYFGLGPFRFTTTKENLNPVLGLEQTTEIISLAKATGILQPIIIIGGIQLADVDELMKAGADGVAVSSAINLSLEPKIAAQQFLRQLETYNSPAPLFAGKPETVSS